MCLHRKELQSCKDSVIVFRYYMLFGIQNIFIIFSKKRFIAFFPVKLFACRFLCVQWRDRWLPLMGRLSSWQRCCLEAGCRRMVGKHACEPGGIEGLLKQWRVCWKLAQCVFYFKVSNETLCQSQANSLKSCQIFQGTVRRSFITAFQILHAL